MKKTSKSKLIAQRTVYAALKILKEAGGEMRGSDVIQKMEETLDFNEYELHIYEKTGYTRWKSVFHFYTIDCIKAGFLRKQKGASFDLLLQWMESSSKAPSSCFLRE